MKIRSPVCRHTVHFGSGSLQVIIRMRGGGGRQTGCQRIVAPPDLTTIEPDEFEAYPARCPSVTLLCNQKTGGGSARCCTRARSWVVLPT